MRLVRQSDGEKTTMSLRCGGSGVGGGGDASCSVRVSFVSVSLRLCMTDKKAFVYNIRVCLCVQCVMIGTLAPQRHTG